MTTPMRTTIPTPRPPGDLLRPAKLARHMEAIGDQCRRTTAAAAADVERTTAGAIVAELALLDALQSLKRAADALEGLNR